MNKNELKPACVFEQFARINEIPRPSKREEKMIEYLKNFGESRGLATKVDETGNVLICKPATPGMENKPTIILQSHMDMVCEKLVDVDFDFDRDAIQTYVDGEWLCAKGTTLGADDGIGCAIELAILDSNDLVHGPLECVFTRDEETGLTGAEGMKAGFMTGDMLINLDSEDEGQIFVTSAEVHAAHQSRKAEEMVAVQMGDEDLRNGLHALVIDAQLRLHVLAAVEEHAEAVDVHHLSAAVARHGGQRRARTHYGRVEIHARQSVLVIDYGARGLVEQGLETAMRQIDDGAVLCHGQRHAIVEQLARQEHLGLRRHTVFKS